ncbi:9697_t:CDS:2, partial [Dentiscutata heterogama]
TRCSNDTVKGAIDTIGSGCEKELSNNNAAVEFIFGFVVFYSPVRNITCFKDKDEYCKDETAKFVLNLPNSPINITGSAYIDAVAVADPEKICTRCNKDMINTLFNFLKNNDLALKLLEKLGIDKHRIDKKKVGVAVKCGINFEDGKVPDLPPN